MQIAGLKNYFFPVLNSIPKANVIKPEAMNVRPKQHSDVKIPYKKPTPEELQKNREHLKELRQQIKSTPKAEFETFKLYSIDGTTSEMSVPKSYTHLYPKSLIDRLI